MAIQSSAVSRSFVGNGVTRVFAVDFPVAEEAHLVVTATDAAGAVRPYAAGKDYQPTLFTTGDGFPLSAQVTLTQALPDGWGLEISRLVPITQESRFANNRGYMPETVERAVDKLTMICQQLGHVLAGMDMPALWAALGELEAGKLDRAEWEGAYRAVAAELARLEAAKATLAYVDQEAARVAKTAEAEAARVAAMFAGYVTGEGFAAYQREVEARFAAIDRRFEDLRNVYQPIAPAGGPWAGSGGSWSRIELTPGEPFKRDDQGYVVQVARPPSMYTPTPIWDVGEYLTVKYTAKPGNSDSCFIIDARGYAVAKTA